MNEQYAYNLLTEPLIATTPHDRRTLPGVLAALARDEVDDFPALRPHQSMFWHMFLVQLAALALHGAARTDSPTTKEEWRALLRGLTEGFPGDEPWCLVVDDHSKPAFMQPPVPDGVVLENDVPSSDALDLLITSKNHDLKQMIARDGQAEDWIYALVTLQTGEGYGGKGNNGIARMNGGSSSRPLLALAPRQFDMEKDMTPRPGAWFRREVRVLLETRERQAALDYPETGGLGLTWVEPWPEDEQLQTRELDIWFIEVCRRVRLKVQCGRLSGKKGTSKATRINAKHLKGAVGDPWAPVHKAESKSFTLAGNDLDYRTLVDLLFSGTWERPILARPASFETASEPMSIVAMALARGNSKTEGFKSRVVPIGGKVSLALGQKRETLHELAKWQVEAIAAFDKALSYALVLSIAGGEREKISREAYPFTKEPRSQLDRYADSVFFDHLWRRFEADEGPREDADLTFLRDLWQRAQAIFEQTLGTMPCPSLYRYRAEARARTAFYGNRTLRKNYPALFDKEEDHAAR